MSRNIKFALLLLAVVTAMEFSVLADEPVKVPPKTSASWTFEQAKMQVAFNPHDPYMQYVALQLAGTEMQRDLIEQLLDQSRPFTPDQRPRRVDLFDLFTGALAVQESLQLESMSGGADGIIAEMGDPKFEKVNVSDLAGPGVKSHPWDKMLAAQSIAGKKPEISELAMCVPEDQYFVLFKSLSKLLEAADAGDLWGDHLFTQAARCAQTQQTSERLKAQLAIRTDPLTRPFYDMVVADVAMTGSDLDFRLGSDVTMLFKLKQPQVFRLRMDGFLAEAQKSRPDATRTSGQLLGVDYVHVATPDRAVYAFSAYPRPDLHVRSNSKAGLESVLRAIGGGQDVRRLGDATEFKYIRTLMPRKAKEEDGFIYLSDPFIRHIVGPELKLTDVRRLLCYNHLRMIGHAAALYRTQFGRPAASLAELVAGGCAPGVFGEGKWRCPCGGQYSLSPDGTTGVCSNHGHARYMVPCREIPATRVTEQEAKQYKQFVDQYNQYWRTYFDPIAIRLQVTPEKYRAETIILPLIDNSIYTGMAAALGGEPQSLDALPVPDRNIFSVAVKLDKKVLMEKAGIRQPGTDTDRLIKQEEIIRDSGRKLEQIGFAMYQYQATNKHLPAVANFDKSQRPLLSWRVHLLPFLGYKEKELYKQFHLNEPWDSDHNKKLVDKMPEIYNSPGRTVRKSGTTTFVVPVGNETAFTGDDTKLDVDKISDVAFETVMVFDAAEKHAVIWTKPDDWTYDPAKIADALFGRFDDVGIAFFRRMSVCSIPKNLEDKTLRAVFTRAGKEIILEEDRIVPVSLYESRGFWGINEFMRHGLDQRELYEFLTAGLGDQVGMHVYDASPMFDFSLTGFLGEAMRGFGGGGRMREEMFYVSFLVSSLNSPVYISVHVKDAAVVDSFLANLDKLLAKFARRPSRGGWIDLDYDFYHLPLGEGNTPARCYNLRFGPVKWRLFFARIGDGLYVASRPFILEDLAELQKKQTATAEKSPASDGGPEAHAMVRVRPEHWKEVLSTFRLGWAEAARQSCLDNLCPLSSAARMLVASGNDKPSGEEISHAADALYGVHFFCPDGGRYQLSADGKEVACSVHGTAADPRQMPAPTAGSPVDRLMKDFGGITAALTFLEDGLHAVVTIKRK